MKLISIIIPVYNAEKYLAKCLDSILIQKYTNLEIILVNDGSTDSSALICEEYANKDNRIKVINKENEGAAVARNLGISLAQGDYIGFVDSDDWIDSDMYEYMYHLLEQNNADLAVASFIRTSSRENISSTSENIIEEIYSQETYMKKYMKIGSQTIEYYPCNKLYKRNVLDQDLYPSGLTTEDVVGTFKAISRASKIISSNKVVYYYYHNKSSVSSNFYFDKALDMITAWDEVIALSNHNAKYKEWAMINRYRIDFNLLFQTAISNNYNQIMKDNLKQINGLISNLKNNKGILLSTSIPFNRKIFIYLFCINYRLTSKVLNLFSKSIKILLGR